jgi:hypothetical protein
MRAAIGVALVVLLLGSACGKSPEQQEYASLKITKLAQDFAHAELSRRCPDAAIKADRSVAVQCVILADDNVAAQAAILAGARAYEAAVSGGDAAKVESALQATEWAVCAAVALFPDPTTPTTGLPADCKGATP